MKTRLTCENCGREFLVSPSVATRGRRVCSIACRWQEDLTVRFWAKVDKRGPDECWPWTASDRARQSNYGGIRGERRGPMLLAHRVSWEIHNGPVPDGMLVLHSCDNPPCCNPRHLSLGTHRDNSADCMARGRFRADAPCGTKNGQSKLTDAAVREIRASKEPQRKLAPKYGVSPKLVSMVRRRLIWRHVQ